MKLLDLFSGIGAFSLAASWYGIKVSQFVEIDSFPQKVLAKNFPGIPIHGDITTFTASHGQFDIVTAGFPCQDLSSANPNGRGLEGKRSGLFFEVIRILRAVRPRFLVLENVPALINGGLDRVLWEIAESGYDAEWQTVSSASVGAPHLRERVFIIAYPKGKRWIQRERIDRSSISIGNQQNTRNCFGSKGVSTTSHAETIGLGSFWQQGPNPEPTICRMDDGISLQLVKHQLKALGNSINPYCAAIAFQRILEIEDSLCLSLR